MFEDPRELSIKAEGTGEGVKMTSTTTGTRNEVRVMFKLLSQALAADGVLPLEEQLRILRKPNIPAQAQTCMDLSGLVKG